MEKSNKYAIGIDLGTSNCCVSVWQNCTYTIIPFNGSNTLPSVVALSETEIYCGEDVNLHYKGDKKNIFYEIKRLIGKKFSEIDDIHLFGYEIVNDVNNNAIVRTTFGRLYTPEELMSFLLIHIKNRIECYLETEITEVVVTIPAYFNEIQRQSVKIAIEMAGLQFLRIINEPTAASLLCGIYDAQDNYKNDDNDKNDKNKEKNIIVYDIGGGTVDVSLIEVDDGVYSVIATSGNSRLGGKDFDVEIMKYCINQFTCKNGIMLSKNDTLSTDVINNLRCQVERAKKQLSDDIIDSVIVNVSNFYNEIDLNIILTRDIILSVCNNLVQFCMVPLQSIVQEAIENNIVIDSVICVGGMSRMPIIRNALKNITKLEPNVSYNPDEIVAIGASIQAFVLLYNDDPFSKNITLLDVTPLSLGVEMEGELMDVIIPRNTNIPTKETKMYTNSKDYENELTIKVFEGERTFTNDNILVGEFLFDSIDKVPKGMAVIEILFSIDVNGILTVVANDKQKPNSKSIIISNKKKLSDNDVKNMIEQSQKYREIDKLNSCKKKNFIALIDMVKSLKHSIEKSHENDNNESNKKIIEEALIYLDKLDVLLMDKTYVDFETDFVKMHTDIIKEKYEVLILNSYSIDNKQENNMLQDQPNLSVMTSVYENDKMQMTDNANKLMKQCTEIKNALSNNTLHLIPSHKKELESYIDNILLWIHVDTNYTEEDCAKKIIELDDECNRYYNMNDKLFRNEILNEYNKRKQFLNNFEDDDAIFLYNTVNRIIEHLLNDETIDNVKDDIINQFNIQYEQYYKSKLQL